MNQFDKKILNHLKKKNIISKGYDASGAALKMGAVKSTNIVLIGYSVGTGLVPFEYEDLRDVLKFVSKKKDLRTNLEAFDKGFHQGQNVSLT